MEDDQKPTGDLGLATKENEPTPRAWVPLYAALLMGHHEEEWIRRESTDFPHPHALYRSTLPIIGFVRSFFGEETYLKGSGARQASRIANAYRGGADEEKILPQTAARYQVPHILRQVMVPRLRQELVRSPGLIRRYTDLLQGPDIDLKCKLPNGKKNPQTIEQFYRGMSEGVLPLLAQSIMSVAESYKQKPDLLLSRAQELASIYKKPNFTPLNRAPTITERRVHVDSFDPSTQAIQLRVETPVGIPPIITDDIHKVLATPLTADMFDILPQQPDLIIKGAPFLARGVIPAYRVQLATSTGFTFFTIDISIDDGSESVRNADCRTGPRATTHDNILAPVEFTGSTTTEKSDYLGNSLIELYFLENTPGVWFGLDSTPLTSLANPVDLGPEWEKLFDGTPAGNGNAIEVLVRSMWQGIDMEFSSQTGEIFVADSVFERCTQALKDMTEEQWLMIPPVQKNMITQSLLKASFQSPHRTVEYLGRSGLWDYWAKPLGITTDWRAIVSKLNEKVNRATYYQNLWGDPHRHRMSTEMRKEFLDGWQLIDSACDIDKRWGTSPYERVSKLFSIGDAV